MILILMTSRSGSSQVWKIRVDGGEAVQVTDLPLDVGNLILSPKGKQFAITLEVFPGKCVCGTKKKLDEIAGQKATGMIYEKILL